MKKLFNFFSLVNLMLLALLLNSCSETDVNYY